VHICKAVHIWQAAPPVPHAPTSVPGWQAPAAQQPVGHEVPSQTQPPPVQR
jgi:hypothetical protein